MSRLAGLALAIAILAVVALMGGGFAQPVDAASYKLCAMRQGQKGPCTCEVKGGTPGEFFTVSRSRCRSAVKPAPPAAAAANETAAAPVEATAPANEAPAAGASSIETGATSKSDDAVAQSAAPVSAASPSANRRLLAVRARGVLNCGINPDLLGFAKRTAAGAWTGIDADFCRAVAAAVLGDAGKVAFIPVETNDRFEALTTGAVDILSRNTTWTMDRDVDMALEFAGILYFDGQGFLTSDARGLVSAQQLGGATICVEQGTTSEANMKYYFAAHKVEVVAKTFANRAELLKAYVDGTCEAITGDRSGLFADRAELENPEVACHSARDHFEGTAGASCPAVRSGMGGDRPLDIGRSGQCRGSRSRQSDGHGQ